MSLDVLQGKEIVLFDGEDDNPHIILVEIARDNKGEEKIIKSALDRPDWRIAENVKSKCYKMINRVEDVNMHMKDYIATYKEEFAELEFVSDDDIVISSLCMQNEFCEERKAVMRKIYQLGDLSGKLLFEGELAHKYIKHCNQGDLLILFLLMEFVLKIMFTRYIILGNKTVDNIILRKLIKAEI